jgi:hypothetical protein
MKGEQGIRFFIFCIITLAIVLYITKEVRNEGFFDNTGALIQLASTEAFGMSPGVMDQLASTEAFGMSPGVMDQLASTRVISKREQEIENHLYNNLTEQGIINMTESGYNDVY